MTFIILCEQLKIIGTIAPVSSRHMKVKRFQSIQLIDTVGSPGVCCGPINQYENKTRVVQN